MKKFKRLTALALALVMVLGLTTGAGAAGAKYSSWFAPYYKEMQELGILPSSFTSGDLTATITRGEMCELAVVAFEKATGNVIDELERTDYFTDTTDKNILKAYEYGIVSGYPDGSFQPNKTLTRQEFFKIIQNFCEAAAYTSTRSKDLSAFADAGSIGSWAREAAQLCVSNAFVDGTKTGSSYYLRPTAGASRQEAMVMFLRAYKDVRQWYDVNITNASVAGTVSGPEEFTDISSTTMYVTASKLNVRAYPSTDEHGTILGKLSYGATVTVTGKSSSWYRIKYNDNGVTCDAYVSREYVDTTPTGNWFRLYRRHLLRQRHGNRYCDFAMSFVGYSYVWGWHVCPSTGSTLGSECTMSLRSTVQHEARGQTTRMTQGRQSRAITCRSAILSSSATAATPITSACTSAMGTSSTPLPRPPAFVSTP